MNSGEKPDDDDDDYDLTGTGYTEEDMDRIEEIIRGAIQRHADQFGINFREGLEDFIGPIQPPHRPDDEEEE